MTEPRTELPDPPRGDRGRGDRRDQRGRRDRGRRDRSRRGRTVLAVGISLVALLAVFGGGYVALSKLSGAFAVPDYTGTGVGTVQVQVAPGDTATDIAHTLVGKGVVKSVKAFTQAARDDARSRGIAPGYYRLHKHMAAAAALKLLLDPSSRVQSQVTIPEGFRLDQVVDRLAKQTHVAASDLQQLAAHPGPLTIPDVCHGQLHGCLFPATYDFPPDATAQGVLQAMLDRFSTAAQQVGLTSSARPGGHSAYDVLIVASLVEREARIPQDRPKVAAVIYNRLAKGMKLQLDSTVNYALHANKTHVSIGDTHVRSPYNTYLHTGLPPTPIAMPGLDSLKAAMHPAQGDWLYFITVDKAGHNKFTSSYQQFLQIKRQVQGS